MIKKKCVDKNKVKPADGTRRTKRKVTIKKDIGDN